MGCAKVRKITSVMLILVLLSLGTVQGETWSTVLLVSPINTTQLYVVTNGFTSYKTDGHSVTFSSKWSGGSLETGAFQITANPWLTVTSSAPLSVKNLSPKEFLVTALDQVAVVLPNVDVDVQTTTEIITPTSSETPTLPETPTNTETPTEVVPTPPVVTPSIEPGIGLYDPQTLQLAIEFRLGKINRQVPAATVVQIATSVSRWANYFNLDPFLVIGLIEMESGFNPNAVSTSSAVGLMQILESNFYSYAATLGVKSDPFDVDSNVAVGCKMLSNSMVTWQRPFMALRSYLLGSTGLMNSILAGSDAADSKGTQSMNYANVVLNIRNSIYQYFNLTPPKEQYVVVLDPGHGGYNPSNGMYNMGAIGLNGIYESEVVLDISQKVADILRSNGLTVQMTRTKEKDKSNPYDLEDRIRLAESFKPNILLSIHANSFTSSTANGVETYWRTWQSKWFATTVHNAYLKQVQLKDRGVKQDTTLFMLKGETYPSAMIEVGFITNPVDYALLSTPEGRTKAAQGIAKGILQFMGIDVKPLDR